MAQKAARTRRQAQKTQSQVSARSQDGRLLVSAVSEGDALPPRGSPEPPQTAVPFPALASSALGFVCAVSLWLLEVGQGFRGFAVLREQLIRVYV